MQPWVHHRSVARVRRTREAHGTQEAFHLLGATNNVPEFTGRYDMTRADYDRTPVKPVLDGEPIYEAKDMRVGLFRTADGA